MISLKVISIKKCCHDSVKLILSDETGSIKFLAGQYLTIILNEQKSMFKSFSIASSPEELPVIELAFRLTDDEFSDYVKNKLTANDIIYALPPEGEFVLDVNSIHSKNIVFFAIGSGITPIYSILKMELEKNSNIKFYLFWGNRNIAQTIYRDEIIQFEKIYPKKFKVFKFFTEEKIISDFFQGRINEKSILSLLSAQPIDLINSDFFICGSSQFVKDISKFLLGKNISKDKIHIEKYNFSEIKNKIEKEINSSKQ